ncbi:MAG: hypothetical protein LN588_02070 [Rickettsia endosymbiont of Bryobia graminum]|nr:hypothetical protein [Rickettsia endosymbiont of Bryobia graminum]
MLLNYKYLIVELNYALEVDTNQLGENCLIIAKHNGKLKDNCLPKPCSTVYGR